MTDSIPPLDPRAVFSEEEMKNPEPIWEATEKIKTFLDLVREYAAATHSACHPECTEAIHRMDAARDLGALKRNPELAAAICHWVTGNET